MQGSLLVPFVMLGFPGGWEKPCRFFRNGQGVCSPRSGSCSYDHTVIPDAEREQCYHKNACSYKPYCIFFHPEGQGEDSWQTSQRKVAKICRYVENGGSCNRSFCSFFHPSVASVAQSFQWDQDRKPPLYEMRMTFSSLTDIPMLPMRIPVVVMNKLEQKEHLKV